MSSLIVLAGGTPGESRIQTGLAAVALTISGSTGSAREWRLIKKPVGPEGDATSALALGTFGTGTTASLAVDAIGSYTLELWVNTGSGLALANSVIVSIADESGIIRLPDKATRALANYPGNNGRGMVYAHDYNWSKVRAAIAAGGGAGDGWAHVKSSAFAGGAKGDSPGAGLVGGVTTGTNDSAAILAAIDYEADYTGVSFSSRFALRAGTIVLDPVDAGKSYRVDDEILFTTTQGGASGSGPVSLRVIGNVGDSPVKANTGAAASVFRLEMSAGIEWSVHEWRNLLGISKDPHWAGTADCLDFITHSAIVGQTIMDGIHGVGVYAKRSLIRCSGTAQYLLRDIKNSGCQISGADDGAPAIVRLENVGSVAIDGINDYSEFGREGVDNAAGSAYALVHLIPIADETWGGSRVRMRDVICGPRTHSVVYCYQPTGGGSTKAESILVEDFFVQVNTKGAEIYGARNVTMRRGTWQAGAARAIMDLNTVDHATLDQVYAQGSSLPYITAAADVGHIEVIDSNLATSFSGAPCGIQLANATATAAFVTSSGVRRRVRRAQAAIVQYTLVKWGATDGRVDQLGTGDDGSLAIGLADQTAATNDFITIVEALGQDVIFKSDGNGTIAPGDKLMASPSSAGRVRVATAGAFVVGSSRATVAATANATFAGRLAPLTGASGTFTTPVSITLDANSFVPLTINNTHGSATADSLIELERGGSSFGRLGMDTSNRLRLHAPGYGAADAVTVGWGMVYKPANQSVTIDAATLLYMLAGTNTGQTASTNVPHVLFDLTATSTFATGDGTLMTSYEILPTTYAFVGDSTWRTYATVYVGGAPTMGTHAIGSPHLYAQLWDGDIALGSPYASGSTSGGNVASPMLIFNGASAIDGSHHVPFVGSIQGVSDGVGTGGLQFAGSLGFFGGTPAVQQSVAAILVNNVTSGGSTSVIADVTNGSTYATDYATIRANFYQLAKKVLALETAARAYGLVIN